MKMHRVQQIHMVGIGGAGMCGIAEVLLQEGYQVSGSDLTESAIIARLRNLGATVYIGHDAEQIASADVVVQSTAVPESNPEIQAAKSLRIPVIPRAQMLGELMRFRQGIAVAGTHGKTTTTSLCTTVLSAAGLDPTYVIGGQLNSVQTHASLGHGNFLVAEADESDASFLHLQPLMAIVTNIDRDHMETYHGDVEQLKQTFLTFLGRLPFYGLAIVCIDDPIVKEILPRISRPIMTYGFSADADFHVSDFVQQGVRSHFQVRRPEGPPLSIELNLTGKHNALNSLAVIAVAQELEIPDDVLIHSLSTFHGVGRRFTVIPNLQIGDHMVTLVDDYGHHPRELQVTIEAARAAWPNKRLVVMFQPHRYSRTHACFGDFVAVLSQVDLLLLLDIYSAGEAPIPGISSASLSEAVEKVSLHKPIQVPNPEDIIPHLKNLLKTDDILLTIGAGNIGNITQHLIKTFMDKS